MRTLTLTEYQTACDVALSRDERDALRRLVPGLSLAPAPGFDTSFDLTPGSWVGTIRLSTLAVQIRPKLSIGNVLFLLGYTASPRTWHDDLFQYGTGTLDEAIVAFFLHHVRRATHRGLLQQYRSREESLHGVRGRLRFEDQIRFRAGRFPPAEVRYDDLTVDVEENRLLKAAVDVLLRLPSHRPTLDRALRQVMRLLEGVSLVPYAPARLPEVQYSALNAHYRPAVELARLILRGAALDLAHGNQPASGFLADMNQVFEDFVVVALREALGLSESSFPQGLRAAGAGAARRRLPLDRAGALRLLPDLSWWEGGDCCFVGDVKYKRALAMGGEHPDLYQLLAYVVAAGLQDGLLIYAAGDPDETGNAGDAWDLAVTTLRHDVVRAGKRLHVATLDLSGPPSAILAQMDALAGQIRCLRQAPAA